MTSLKTWFPADIHNVNILLLKRIKYYNYIMNLTPSKVHNNNSYIGSSLNIVIPFKLLTIASAMPASNEEKVLNAEL